MGCVTWCLPPTLIPQSKRFSKMIPFTHLHVHNSNIRFSMALQAYRTGKKSQNRRSGYVALGHGSMFGIKEFFDTCRSRNGIKPILGCETYVASRGIHFKDKNEKEDRSGDHLILLAKNEGISQSTEINNISQHRRLYYKARIDKQLLERFHRVLLSLGLSGGEIPQLIMKGDTKGAGRPFSGTNRYLAMIITSKCSATKPMIRFCGPKCTTIK